MSTQQFQGKVEFEDDVKMKGRLVSEGTVFQRLGRTRVQQFTVSLDGVDGSSTQFSDNDVLANLGQLDVVSAGDSAATHIVIEKIIVKVTEAAGVTLEGNLALGTANNDAVNESVTGALEIAGAGATYSDAQGGDSGLTEADLNLNATGVSVVRPYISTTVDKLNLYARTTTTLNAALSAGTATIQITYSIV